MRPKLQALAGQQGGVFTRRQALAVGYTDTEIRSFTRRDGPWVVVRRGAYSEREVWDSADKHDGHLRLKDRGAHLQMTLPHLMSHDSAARLQGLPMLRPEEQLVHVTRFGVGGSRTSRGVKHHLTRLGLLTAANVDGVRTTGLARTALDLAREHGALTGTMAVDAARRRGVGLDELENELLLMRCWPNVTEARAAVEVSDPGAQTPGETLLRLLLLELDLGPIICQFPVWVGRRLYWVDVLVGPHAFEFDGFVKFTRGALDRDPGQTAWDEKMRQDELNRAGLGVSRAIWGQLLGASRRQTGRRLEQEWRTTAARLGTDIPAQHLAFFQSEEGQRLRAKRLRDD